MGESGSTRKVLSVPSYHRQDRKAVNTVKRNHPNPRRTKAKTMQGEVHGDCDKNRSRELQINPIHNEQMWAWDRHQAELTVTFLPCVLESSTGASHGAALQQGEQKQPHESSAIAARHKSSFDKELQKGSVMPKWASNWFFFIFNSLPFVTFF